MKKLFQRRRAVPEEMKRILCMPESSIQDSYTGCWIDSLRQASFDYIQETPDLKWMVAWRLVATRSSDKYDAIVGLVQNRLVGLPHAAALLLKFSCLGIACRHSPHCFPASAPNVLFLKESLPAVRMRPVRAVG